PTVQTWRSTQLFDALRPEGDDPRAVTKAAQTCGLLYLDDLAALQAAFDGILRAGNDTGGAKRVGDLVDDALERAVTPPDP
ncbi:hypothetical protein KBZ21_41535, partial [Streptomyces sp. A73]|nr:hypothetical protein [Streptomyces sp. A73]